MELNPEVKDIHGFHFEDFELIGYDPAPAIKAPGDRGMIEMTSAICMITDKRDTGCWILDMRQRRRP